MPPLLSDITTRLASISDTPALDASVLIAHIVKKPRTWVMAHPEFTVTAEQQKQLEEALARLEHDDPFPYVLGHWEFFGLEFDITPDVLIPRPETELLVEKGIAWMQRSKVRRTVADVGTGSGIIAITIAANIPDARILATDISPAALQVAQNNARKFRVDDRIRFVECDILPPHPKSLPTEEHFDLLCANLPYIPTETLHSLPVYGREPTLALDGGADGLDLFRRLMKVAPEWMAPNSLILLEIEATLGVRALNLACDMFSRAEIHLHQDLTGRDRLLEIML
ncbi:MAG: peptide chain release factor N(5)-glutamine methyltransferase [Anaerolineales bacterium]|nr:peptide chain release factor N(5)-glutamine methyltransferase [Anaerolineales bacterium]NTW12197.1 peptide chain release factor N(5)-glutamine methyltransferase [Anaerolineales bacterium]